MRGIALPSIILSVSFTLLSQASPTHAGADGAAAEQILAELSHLAPEPSRLVSRSLAQAKRALDRARSARDAGDASHAEKLEGLAREWAETGKDLLRAAQAETEAGTLEQRATVSAVRSERARALLEESIARKGEAEAQLNRQMTPEAPLPPPNAGSKSKAGVADRAGEGKTRVPTLAAAMAPDALEPASSSTGTAAHESATQSSSTSTAAHESAIPQSPTARSPGPPASGPPASGPPASGPPASGPPAAPSPSAGRPVGSDPTKPPAPPPVPTTRSKSPSAVAPSVGSAAKRELGTVRP